MTGYLHGTVSTCRVCGTLLPAQVWLEPDGAYLRKDCPRHGPQRARFYGDAEAYRRLDRYHRKASAPHEFATAYAGCPDSCGLCPEHEQHVCLPILEITDHCNLRCPVCLVHTPGRFHRTRAEVGRMLDALIEAEGQIDVLNLSGGEPTLHPAFLELLDECVQRPEILRVSVSTNGLELVRRPELLDALAARRVIVSLQFDGLTEAPDLALRGRRLLPEKLRLIEACGERDLAMSLTTTVVRGVNDQALRPILDLLFARRHILSVMFQPACYAGEAARLARPPDATTLPDVVAALAGGYRGTVSAADFSPLPCGHPACFSLAFYLRLEGDRFLSIRQLVAAERYLDLVQNRALLGADAEGFAGVSSAVYDLWSGPAGLSPDSQTALRAVKRLLAAATRAGGYSPAQAFLAAERDIKSIFIHQFMDRHTFDLSRARKCCQVYPQPDGRCIPVCVHNCLRRCP